jgi:hypothetical protein
MSNNESRVRSFIRHRSDEHRVTKAAFVTCINLADYFYYFVLFQTLRIACRGFATNHEAFSNFDLLTTDEHLARIDGYNAFLLFCNKKTHKPAQASQLNSFTYLSALLGLHDLNRWFGVTIIIIIIIIKHACAGTTE